jgi:alpha-amylase/alpha-mannosidase (GH57 family)
LSLSQSLNRDLDKKPFFLMKPYVCIHGHFYQPPRENPWLGEVEIQDSAYPFHDWNERISAECYAPNSAARILDDKKNIINILNNYTKLSFNFGPTLLSWVEKHEPEIYAAILEADKQSQKRFSGHGSAIAQAYNHIIMPLANSRDKHTQIFWGIQDFSYRFKRKPEGMWLPETAVDLDTLEIMAQQGIKFTILSPVQAHRVRKIGNRDWMDVKGGKVDPTRPYTVQLSSGKRIAVFLYDGPISHDIAFGDLLKNGELFAQKLLQSFSQEQVEAQIVHIATDGESYGHHHRFGDMALAYCLDKIESDRKASLTVYGEYLERYPPEYEVEIAENSSWSCAHGVERWRNDCGCHTGQHPGWTQAWRAPLREAMDWLRDQVIPLYEKESAWLVKDPWGMRNEYIHVVLNRSEKNVESFFSKNFSRNLSQTDETKVLKLLELQRNALFMFTSCGWFFDDISGIESIQVMKYAGRVIQLAREIDGIDIEPGYLKRIERASSNKSAFSSGAEIYEQFVKPAVLDLLKIGVHYAVSSLFEDYPETIRIGEYTAQSQSHDIFEFAPQKLTLGKARIRSDVLWEEDLISYAVLHLGHHNLSGGARPFTDDHVFSQMESEIKEAFQKGDVPQVVRLMDKHFGDHNYTLWNLLKDKKREILNQILESTLIEAEASLRQIFEKHYSIMFALKENNVPLPKAFSTSVEFILNADFRKLMGEDELDIEGIKKIVDEFKKWTLHPDKTLLGFVTSSKINKIMAELHANPENMSLLKTIDNLLEILRDFPLDLNLWKSQNIYFTICKGFLSEMQEKIKSGDPLAQDWIESMKSIGRHLHVKCL